MAASYQNFDIRVLRKGAPRQYQLIIQYPGVQPESGQVIDCELPPSYADLLTAAPPERQRRWRKSTMDLLKEESLACYATDLEAVKEIGDRLFRTVLQGELAGEYGVVADNVAREGGMLRLRINLTNAPELSREPWEALYRKRNEVLLAIHAATPIVRLLDSPTAPDATPVAPPVRLLVVTAVPSHDLDVDQELANIRKRTERLVAGSRAVPFSTRVLEAATRATLSEAIREFQPHFLHYIGHGSFERGSGWIHLHDVDDLAEVDHIDAETLRDMLANQRPKLVVLNTCEGGIASEIDTFSGMAHALIQRNIPYVVAMQYPISDDAAIAFSDVLYADLAGGKPIDVAVTNARNAIRLLKEPSSQVELITPVLYTSGSIDRLVDPVADASPATDAAPVPKSARRRRKFWIIGAAVGGVAAIAILLGSFIWLGSEVRTEISPDAGVERPSLAPGENAMGSDELSELPMMPPGPPANAVDDEVYEMDSGAGGPELVPRPQRPRRARRSAPDMPRPAAEPAPAPLEQPSAPLPPRPPPPPPPIEATEDRPSVQNEYQTESDLVEAIIGRILGGLQGGSIFGSLDKLDAPLDTPDGASQVGLGDTLNVSGAITVSATQVADSGRMAELRELPVFRSVSADPDIFVSITGRGGGTYSERVALGGQLAAGLAPDVPPTKVQVDAVADDRSARGAATDPVEAELSLRLSGAEQIRFGFDSDVPAQEELPRLERIAMWLSRHPESKIILRAHSDARGPEDYNLGLAQRRADAVRDGLVKLGVAESRIDEMVIGEGMPEAGPGATAADDRRVELLLTLPVTDDAAREAQSPE